MSSASVSPDRSSRHVIEFPDVIPADVHVDVPRPLENHPDWTSITYSHADIPPMFDDLVKMPDCQTEPALYAAAADTIRMTNTYFDLTGSYSSEHSRQYPLTRDLILEQQYEWTHAEVEHGNDDFLTPVTYIPMPPDSRTLFVKEDMGDPTDDNLEPLWIKAFEEVTSMSDLTWKIYLGYTRQQLIDQANTRNPQDEAWLILEIFKRYLVWNELYQAESNRAQRFEQKQPTWTELEDFFNREDVRKEGVTLVDICHAFPRARDAQMLVYRVEHFAALEKQPSTPMDGGIEDPVESRYIPRSPPSSQDIKETASTLLRLRGSSVSLKELADRYLPSRVQVRLIKDVLIDLGAQPDTTTGRFTLHGNGPLLQEMKRTLEHESAWYVNGVTLQDVVTSVARSFSPQVQDRKNFLRTISNLYSFDKAEQRFFPLHKDEENGGTLSPEHSLIARDKARIRMAIGQGDLVWDRELLTYVSRAHGSHLNEIGGGNSHVLDPGSPSDTVPDTIAGGTPPPGSTNSIGKITALEIEPISPGAGSFAPLAPAARASAGAIPDPSIEETAAGMSPPVAKPDKPGQGKKRGPTEESLESSKGKKARKTYKLRCSRKTLKNTRCKKQKDREDGEDEWDCGAHKQG